LPQKTSELGSMGSGTLMFLCRRIQKETLGFGDLRVAFYLFFR